MSRIVKTDTLEILLAYGASLFNRAIQAHDPTALAGDWTRVDVRGPVNLGCLFASHDSVLTLVRSGTTISPVVPDLLYNAYCHRGDPLVAACKFDAHGPHNAANASVYAHYVSVELHNLVTLMPYRCLHHQAPDEAAPNSWVKTLPPGSADASEVSRDLLPVAMIR